jgi:hypothetical protein
MRTERPTLWGFDVWDPRLQTRQAAAAAQQLIAVEDWPAADEGPTEEVDPIEEPETVGVGVRRD